MIYQAECLECGHGHEYSRSVANCMDVPVCPVCGHESKKVIRTAPTGFVSGKFEQYRSQVDGTLIRTQKDLAEHNRRNGVVLLNEGYSEEAIRSGKLGQQKPPVVVKREEVIQDMQEAIHDLENGYKPQKIEVEAPVAEGWSSNIEVPNE